METKVISSCGFSNYNKENQSKIVVLGGSFNPPTTAHLALMKAAVDAAGAQLGLFVPTLVAPVVLPSVLWYHW